MILIANNAAETELLNLALNRLHGTQEPPAQTLVNAEQLIEVRSVVPVPSFPLCGCKLFFFQKKNSTDALFAGLLYMEYILHLIFTNKL